MATDPEDDIGDDADDAARSMSDHFAEQPLTALAIAAVIGFVIGRWLF